MSWWKRTLFAGLFLVTSLTVAQTADAPALTDLKNQVVKLESYRSRVVLVNFWATWCAPCRQEMPELDQLATRYAQKKFTVLGVAADEPADVKTFVGKLGIHYPIAVGDPDQVFAWSARLGNQSEGLPFSILLDGSGKVRWSKSGGRISVAELQPVIDKLLVEKKQ